jgi:SAM-dependent methyltransferase
MRRTTKAALVGGAALAAGAAWERTHPSPCPYSQRWLIEVPRPGITFARLRELLEPRAGERMLEVGPGTGYYALPVADALGPGGRLDALDVQQEMLDHLSRAASERGLGNIEPVLGDAASLPYEDACFDAVYLVTVLGEVPDQQAALRELRRVLKPDGRLVFGETLLDPHVVSLSKLRERCLDAGLRFERKLGSPVGWFARFTPA